MDKPYQRLGSISNAHVGNEFELRAQDYFSAIGLDLSRDFSIEIGAPGRIKKRHRFDLGSQEHFVIVECKTHTWTAGDKVPSAKMTTWNQEMYYLHLAPAQYRKILFVLRNVSESRNLSLAAYYVKTYSHLIPTVVDIWEFDTDTGKIHYPLQGKTNPELIQDDQSRPLT